MVALVLTTGSTAETIEGSVRVRVAEFEPFFHCKVSSSGYVCTPPGGSCDSYFPDLVQFKHGMSSHAYVQHLLSSESFKISHYA